MSQNKSPFYVVENFLSPKQADYIVDALNIVEPDTDKNNHPIKSTRFNHHCESVVFNMLEELKPQVEQYYDFEWKGTEVMSFEFVPEESVNGYEPGCGNAIYTGGKWLRNKNRDFTGVIFLSDYNDASADEFDPNYEVFGGKLQFPQYGFSFQPQRGTMIIFPAGPNFINALSQVQAGDLYMVRFHICAEKLWPYNPKNFPGTYKTWF